LLRELFAPQGVKQIASRLGRSRWLVHKWTQPAGVTASGTRNPLDALTLLMDCTDPRRLAQWVCERAGGYFVSNPQSQPGRQPALLLATGKVIAEMGLLQSALGDAVKDCRVTRTEAAEMRHQWETLKADMEGYVKECEGNVFCPSGAMSRSLPRGNASA
jgi:hypothetical protein